MADQKDKNQEENRDENNPESHHEKSAEQEEKSVGPEEELPQGVQERIKRTFFQKLKAAYAAFSLHNLKEKLDDFIGISFKIFLAIAIIVIGSTLYTELTDRRYSITSFQVPKSFENEGLDGNAVVKKLLGRVGDLQRGADTILTDVIALAELEDETGSFRDLRRSDTKQAFVSSADKQAVNVDVMGVGVSIDAVIYYIKRLLGIKTRTIQGVISTDGKQLRLIMNMTDSPTPVRLKVPYDSLLGSEKCLEGLLTDAAKKMLEVTSPNRLALYFLADAGADLINESDSALIQSMQTFRKVTQNFYVEKSDRAYAYSMLGYLTYLKAPIDARKKYSDRKNRLDSLKNILTDYEKESEKLKDRVDTLRDKLQRITGNNYEISQHSGDIRRKLLRNDFSKNDSLRTVRSRFRNTLDSLGTVSASNDFILRSAKQKVRGLSTRIDTLGNTYTSLKNRYDNLFKAYATDFEQEKSRLSREATKKAIVLFNKALNIKPDATLAYQLWALVLHSEKNYYKAIQKLKELLSKVDKQNVDALLNWAFMLENMGYSHEAAEKYRRIMKIDRTNLTALSAWMTILEEKTAKRKALSDEGEAETALKEYKEIIDYADELIELLPNSEKAYLYRAQAYQRLGKYEKAETLYRKTISISEQNFWVLKSLGSLYIDLARESRSKKEKAGYFRKAAAVYKSIAARTYIGNMRFNEFQKKLPLQSTGKWVGLDSELYPTYISLKGLGDIALEKGKNAEALSHYRRIAEYADEDYRYGSLFKHEAFDLILRTHAKAGESKSFYSLLDSAMQNGIPIWENLTEPPYSDSLNNPKFKNRIKEYAIKPLRIRTEAEVLGREQVFAFDSLAYRYRLVGEYDSAVFYAKQAIRLDSSSPDAYATLAETYGIMKKEKQFYRYLDSAVKYRFEIWKFIGKDPYKKYSRQKSFSELIEKYERKNEYEFL